MRTFIISFSGILFLLITTAEVAASEHHECGPHLAYLEHYRSLENSDVLSDALRAAHNGNSDMSLLILMDSSEAPMVRAVVAGEMLKDESTTLEQALQSYLKLRQRDPSQYFYKYDFFTPAISQILKNQIASEHQAFSPLWMQSFLNFQPIEPNRVEVFLDSSVTLNLNPNNSNDLELFKSAFRELDFVAEYFARPSQLSILPQYFGTAGLRPKYENGGDVKISDFFRKILPANYHWLHSDLSKRFQALRVGMRVHDSKTHSQNNKDSRSMAELAIISNALQSADSNPKLFLTSDAGITGPLLAYEALTSLNQQKENGILVTSPDAWKDRPSILQKIEVLRPVHSVFWVLNSRKFASTEVSEIIKIKFPNFYKR